MAEMQLEEDTLISILTRLPVKSLIRCTCVCKYWLSLIRSPDFVAKHHSTRSELFEYDSVLALFNTGCSISLFSYQDLTFQTAFKFRPAVAYDPLRFEIYHRDIISDCFVYGPCNGLFLIQLSKGCLCGFGAGKGVRCASHQVLLLWNPATKEVFKLPKIPSGVACVCYGFGFDTVTKDYKVVGLFARPDVGAVDYSVVWLYSLATNSWRQLLDAFMYMDGFYVQGESSSNGRMHNWIWFDSGVSGQRRFFLLSFDMVDEVFVETPLPSDESYIQGFLYQGSNHMHPTVYRILDNIELHVWGLQGYGPTGIWNKLLNIRLPDEFIRTPYMVLWKNKNIVFSSRGTLCLLNLTTQQARSLRIPADESIIAYTESLVSIAGSVHQPPTMDHSSEESVPLELGDEGPVDDEQDLFETIMVHQMLPKEDDDSDDSSTDSAFLAPEITAFTDTDTIYIDYETDMDFNPRRKNEIGRLSKLPYCLHEINKPMISNPCTF